MFEEKLLEPHFTSVLAPYMLDVVEQKRALGNKYNAGVEALSAFDDFCNEQQLRIPAISKELLQKWEKKRPHENETTQCFRISYVRILCKYLHSNGYDAPCAFHPAPHVNKCFVPYIFTKDEIERLFSAVDCTKESSESPLRHLVMPVLFRLLYTCGLRVSEALHLKVADVDLDAGVLAIYGAKGDKERLVGISDSMLASLPLDTKTGNAIADYILHARPKCKSEYIFLRVLRPYTKIGSMWTVIAKYAHIALGKNRKMNGPHAFRRGMGRQLLEANIPAPLICDILGHSSSVSLRQYTASSLEKLKVCAGTISAIPIAQEALL